MSERPPLTALACEAIDRSLHDVDKVHWLLIGNYRIKRYYPLGTPVPPTARQHLLLAIRLYAMTLFSTEADQYERFRHDQQYTFWLSVLADRIKLRVLAALNTLEESEPDSMLLAYHGLQKADVEESLRGMLWERSRDYAQGHAPSQLSGTALESPLQSAQKDLAPQDLPSSSLTSSDTALEPEQNEREKFVLPILDEKGWSILRWATEADVTKDTATDYLANRTKPYRSTRLKLAKALGVMVQRLPR